MSILEVTQTTVGLVETDGDIILVTENRPNIIAAAEQGPEGIQGPPGADGEPGVAVHNEASGLNDGDYKHLTAQQYTKLLLQQYNEVNAGNSGASKTIDWNDGLCQYVSLTANCAFTFTAPPFHTRVQLRVIQGSSNYSATWDSGIHFTASGTTGLAPSFPATSGYYTMLSWYWNGSIYCPLGYVPNGQNT